MKSIKSALSPELAKFIKEHFPVSKNRSALWFFINQFRNNLVQKSNRFDSVSQAPLPSQVHDPDSGDGGGEATDIETKSGALKLTNSTKNGTKVSRSRILQIWMNMDPESKRKYFNMAEFDQLRYKEQKSLWVSQVGALARTCTDIEQIKELAPTHDSLQSAFLESLDKLHENYEQMIQTESTKMLYKQAIKKADTYSLYSTSNAHDLISTVPMHHEPILSRPRRPPTAFVLYLNDHRERHLKMRRETRTKDSYMRFGAIEWSNLSQDIKQIYEDRYQKLKREYDRAMELYRSELQESSVNYLELASREKRSFRKSLRKRLKDSSLLPIGIRNAFNFFVMDNKKSKFNDLIEMWHNLPMDKKMKYTEMSQQDVIRYQQEVKAYNEMRQTMDEIMNKRRAKSSEHDDGDGVD